MTALYNDTDRKAAAWLRELIAHGHIMEGAVDERSIAELGADDLNGYRRCHFFAGIGGWDYALRLAGWPDDRPVWTGSCPCQPFSSAGRRGAEGDDRHLWPEFYRLIADCRPPVVFGEQVASKDGRAWLAGVRADLGSLGYSVGAADLCAAGVGAPHIRQRLYWVADATHADRGSRECGEETGVGQNGEWRRGSASGGDAGRLGHANVERCEGQPLGLLGSGGQGHWSRYDLIPCRDGKSRRVESKFVAVVDGISSRMVHCCDRGDATEAEAIDAEAQVNRDGRGHLRTVRQDGLQAACSPQGREPGEQLPGELADLVRLLPSSLALAELHGHAATTEALLSVRQACGAAGLLQHPPESLEAAWRSLAREARQRLWDAVGAAGLVRTVEFPLAHGVPARVGRLRGYGNAIVPQVAAEFVMAYAGVQP